MSHQDGWRRIASATALALVLGLGAVGCGGGDDDEGDTTSAAGGDTTATTDTAAGGGGGKTFPELKVSWLPPDQLDPGLSYTVAGWQVMWNVYMPLITYKHVNGPDGSDFVPALAKAMPEISNGNKTYKFMLREGLKYSDGKPVKASDFAFTIKRLFLIDSPGVGFFTDIVGASKFAEDRKGEISGIKTDDATGEITINLASPRGDFLNILATTFAALVPTGTAPKDQSTTPIPSTGPYRIVSYKPNRSFVLERNPNWAKIEGIPDGNPDKVTATIYDNDVNAYRSVVDDKSDYDELALPTDRLAEAQNSYGDQLKFYTPASTYYLFLNHRIAPFDKKAVRQAVNYAIDREAMVQLFGGLGEPTQNFLPPSYPQYEKITTYKYDLAKAKQLIQQAGATGATVTVWGHNSEIAKKVTAYVADQLTKAGMKAKPKNIARGIYFDTIGNQKTKAQMGYANWYQDFPHPLDWIDVLLNGDRITEVKNNNYGNVDVKAYNAEIDALKKEPELTDAVNKRWAALDRKYVVEDAAVVPYLNEEGTDFFSSRMDLSGGCYVWHVLYNWDFAQSCVK